MVKWNEDARFGTLPARRPGEIDVCVHPGSEPFLPHAWQQLYKAEVEQARLKCCDISLMVLNYFEYIHVVQVRLKTILQNPSAEYLPLQPMHVHLEQTILDTVDPSRELLA